MIKLFLSITVCIGFAFLFARAHSEFHIRRTNTESLTSEKIASDAYPWSSATGTITKVTDYREAYDIDSNDWIAQFSLDTSETKKLSDKLVPLSPTRIAYRCIVSFADWPIERDICDASKMFLSGFKGYFYNPSFCQMGCRQNIILWVNESTGESYIVASPDYD